MLLIPLYFQTVAAPRRWKRGLLLHRRAWGDDHDAARRPVTESLRAEQAAGLRVPLLVIGRPLRLRHRHHSYLLLCSFGFVRGLGMGSR